MHNLDKKCIRVSDKLAKNLRAYVDRMIEEWRYDRDLFRIACDLNVPKIEPSVMSIIFGWIMDHGQFPSHEETFNAARRHPEYRIYNDGSLGTNDEVLYARVYNFLVGSYREVDVILNMQNMNSKSRLLKAIVGDVKDRIDFVYRLGSKQYFFAVKRDGDPTIDHEQMRGKPVCKKAIQLISHWDKQNRYGLQLVSKHLYEKYTLET